MNVGDKVILQCKETLQTIDAMMTFPFEATVEIVGRNGFFSIRENNLIFNEKDILTYA